LKLALWTFLLDKPLKWDGAWLGSKSSPENRRTQTQKRHTLGNDVWCCVGTLQRRKKFCADRTVGRTHNPWPVLWTRSKVWLKVYLHSPTDVRELRVIRHTAVSYDMTRNKLGSILFFVVPYDIFRIV
jgi:hypothetical protein